ncbi:hypothetical protein A3D03_05805 [Candidatus Gottesmanbacteria bacterium RIFCSPHIGHO2_02_FULL_40_13]|uniref:Endolytic murein transglycosylase n=1 Tax=Candidatus Gottesmanbacteria bacterium RIFCSPHIGHO2_02_FULL_40_13 TaxID=1798384 RepID=A0A1F6A969_9BACT|nr:MAG: hypothetical protein A3D03_05805 [Candidatus Gottesmanbacteria bacterium RIFCSPHIGHO2_02_FULL_40_13]
MKKKFYILFLLLFIIGIVCYLWWKQAILGINPADKTFTTFVIRRGETARTVAERLRSLKLIRSPVAFFLIARFGGVGDNLQVGEFNISPSMDLPLIAKTLTHGTSDTWITIPEGWRNEEIALELTQKLSIPESEFLKKAQEGYMFPDTYLVPKEASAASVVNILLDNFHSKIGPGIIEQAAKKGLNINQLITIASLVEREGRHDGDRPVIASVILNRLNIGMKLDIDATIQFALGYQSAEKTWWKKNLTLDDINLNSAYNTYKNPGLPPGPIANPGLQSIMAVINAPETDYLYYISDSQGEIHPAETIEEHNANIAKYLNK